MRMVMISVMALALGVGAAAAAGEPAAGEHRLLLVQKDGDALRVIQDVRVPLPLPVRRGPPKNLPWRVQIEDDQGRVMRSVRIQDPTLVRGEFHAADGSGRIDAVRFKRKGKVTFPVRVPAEGARTLLVQRLKADAPRQSAQPASAWERVGEIHLAARGGGR